MLCMRLFLTFCQTKYKIRGISGRCVLKVPKLLKYSFKVKQKLQKCSLNSGLNQSDYLKKKTQEALHETHPLIHSPL